MHKHIKFSISVQNALYHQHSFCFKCYYTRCLVSRKNVPKLNPKFNRELVLLDHTLTCLLIQIVLPAGQLLDVPSRF